MALEIKVSKILLWLCILCFSAAVLCILLLLLVTIIYGPPAGITTDPNDFRLEKGDARYMTEDADRLHSHVWGILVHVGWISSFWGFIIYGARFLLMKKKE